MSGFCDVGDDWAKVELASTVFECVLDQLVQCLVGNSGVSWATQQCCELPIVPCEVRIRQCCVEKELSVVVWFVYAHAHPVSCSSNDGVIKQVSEKTLVHVPQTNVQTGKSQRRICPVKVLRYRQSSLDVVLLHRLDKVVQS